MPTPNPQPPSQVTFRRDTSPVRTHQPKSDELQVLHERGWNLPTETYEICVPVCALHASASKSRAPLPTEP